jgi:hypothetical protein
VSWENINQLLVALSVWIVKKALSQAQLEQQFAQYVKVELSRARSNQQVASRVLPDIFRQKVLLLARNVQ